MLEKLGTGATGGPVDRPSLLCLIHTQVLNYRADAKMFRTAQGKRRVIGLILLAVLVTLFLWFNRIPKLDTVQADLDLVTGPAVECFQGFCIDSGPGSTLLSRWWDFSLAYLKLVTVGMLFAFLVAGLTEVFLFPPNGAQGTWSQGGIRGSIRGLLMGSAMNLCSACIVPVSSAFRRRGAGIESTLAIVQGSCTMNLPALVMALMVFTPMLAGARIGLSLVGALLLGPLVVFAIGRWQREAVTQDELPVIPVQDILETRWLQIIKEGLRDWLFASTRYFFRLAPIMVLAGFASALAIQLISPDTVSRFLGDNFSGIVLAATLGLLINVPLLFEIPLVAALLLVGMGTAPAATLLFAAAAGGPITFWGLARVMPRKAIAVFATATWTLGIVGGLSVLALGTLFGGDGPNLRVSASKASEAGGLTEGGDEAELTPSTLPVELKLTNLQPDIASTLGDVLVTLKGSGFVNGAGITIDGVESAWAYTDENTMTAWVPPHGIGTVDVVITNPDGSTSLLPGALTYELPIFIEVGDESGVAFTHYRDIVDIIPLGAGVVVFDFNGDGKQDIYVTSTEDIAGLASDTQGNNALYRNNGDGSFTDVAAQAGVSDLSGKGNGGCAADYDNDGDQDLFVANWGSSKLFRNQGDGTFFDVTVDAGVTDPNATYRSMGCAWGDYDRDGYLDLIVVRHIDESNPDAFTKRIYYIDVRPLALYHNNGDGAFTNVTDLLGGATSPLRKTGAFGNIWGAGFQPRWVDFDNDGDPDLYVVNDFGEDIQPNVLWRNDGPGEDGSWIFTDISSASGANLAMFGMGIATADINNDGYFDFFVTNIGDNRLLISNSDGASFEDAAAEAGVAVGTFRRQQRVSWGAVFFDYDNDGYEDLYFASGWLDTDDINRREQPNMLFRNNGGDGTFTDYSNVSGAADWGAGRGVVYADFNGDGCLDLYLTNLGRSAARGEQAKLFLNRCQWGNNWIIIKTVGVASNRDGIGARITVVTGERSQIREVTAGSGNKSQNMLPVHFGLGKSDRIDSIEILWPSGARQILTDVVPNQLIAITEP